MDRRNVAEQELFLPSSGQSQDQTQQGSSQSETHPRYYANLNSQTAEQHGYQSQDTGPAAVVPSINVINATPTTSRSSTVRSNVTRSTEPNTMAGALPEVEEEDDLYDAPTSSGSSYPSVPQSAPYPPPSTTFEPVQSTADSTGQFHEEQIHQPSLQTQQPAPVPSHPPTYEEDRASRKGTEPEVPPRSILRPPIPQQSTFDQDSSSVHPSVHLDADEDYALALQLQQEEDERAPPLPQRPGQEQSSSANQSTAFPSHAVSSEDQDYALALSLQEEEDHATPALPIRPGQQTAWTPPEQRPFVNTPSIDRFAPPPRRQATDFGTDNPADPVHYTRDPHKLTAYLIPFPTPVLANAPSESIPKRFLIYTPPPPPLQAPPEGVKEDRTHKIQRKWQDEVRRAKSSEAKTTSWAGFRAKMTRGVSKAMTYTTSSNIDFLGRVQPMSSTAASTPSRSPSPPLDRKSDAEQQQQFPHSQTSLGPGPSPGVDAAQHQSHETKKTVGIDTMVFVYSPSMNLNPDEMRTEFVNTVMRTKSKAMRDSVIATGLLPISLAVDIVLIAVSGLFEVNAVWAYANIKGAKTARSVSKRLASSTDKAHELDPEKSEAELRKEQDVLKLEFKPAARIDVLARYLHAECRRVDGKLWPHGNTIDNNNNDSNSNSNRLTPTAPTESDCLEAIGWAPHQTAGEKNWEDEAWELSEVKDDLKVVMHKAAKEWRRYCVAYEKNPEKNLNK